MTKGSSNQLHTYTRRINLQNTPNYGILSSSISVIDAAKRWTLDGTNKQAHQEHNQRKEQR